MVVEATKHPASLLVVDDDGASCEIMARWLRTRQHEVATAESAAAALELMERALPDLILLDVMMPEVDGLQLLRRLRREHTASRLPIIMVTAVNQSREVVEALRLGANDYVTKPVDFPVVLARVETQLSLKRAMESLEAANRRMRQDLEAASAVQRSFLPEVAPAVPGLRAAWVFRPCQEVGGDLFNVFTTESGRVGFYMLDASGHGVPAALTAVSLTRVLAPWPAESSLLRRRVEGEPGHPFLSPAEAAARVNRHFGTLRPGLEYITLFYGVLDVRRRDLHFTSAGHPHIARVTADGEASFVEAEGFPIGWVEEPDYRDTVLQLAPHDRLYLCSDGIMEARNGADDYFGRCRLLGYLGEARRSPLGASLDGLLEEVASWSRLPVQDDDVSALALELEG